MSSEGRKTIVVRIFLKLLMSRVVKECLVLLTDIMEGNIVIPEFKEFCDDIEELYIR